LGTPDSPGFGVFRSGAGTSRSESFGIREPGR
jgi:hypothetical protein